MTNDVTGQEEALISAKTAVQKTEQSLSSSKAFYRELDLCLLVDKPRLKKLWFQIDKRRKEQKDADRSVQKLAKALVQSQSLRSIRADKPLAISFPSQLPISDKRAEIAELIKHNSVVVLAGETGSGKTTQIPKICLELGRGVDGLIGHTQPRRIAARTVASRIAQELEQDLGQTVGYQVRFNDQVSQDTRVKLMTDGILLAEIQHDPMLLKYDTLIIDEAHERSLNIDFLLGYLRQLLDRRKDLKVIITSATIDLDSFSKHFDDAPILQVSGRTYPVELIYQPLEEQGETQEEAIVSALHTIESSLAGREGDVLVFLSGEREIRETAQAIRRSELSQLEVLPLYARLSLTEQNRVFQRQRGRKVVLATNVAETSITVPGIRYVIDPGTARISRYSVRTKVQRLPLERISQASANQRMGRCGRVSDGVCIRLYSEEDFLSRPAFTEPEILRTNLAAVVLQMLHLRVGDIRKFPFIERPESKLINDGFKLLESIQAIAGDQKLTSLGRQLSQLPVDPRLGRILIEADRRSCLREILIIVTALAVQDPRERPHDKKQAADEKHRRFQDKDSDLIAYVNLWNYYEEQRQELSQNQLRRLCAKEFISFLKFKEWRELHHQVRISLKSLSFKENTSASEYEAIHRALLSGFFENVGIKNDEKGSRDYMGTRSRRSHIFPGSALSKSRPKWTMCANYLETSRLFAHGTAKVDPAWILDAAHNQLKHHFFEPHYSAKNGQVMAYDRISLYGLVIVEKQRVNFSKVDSKLAREIFIRAAFVEGGYPKNSRKKVGEFYRYNTAKINEILNLEAKIRRRDIMVDDEVIFQFYDEKIPAHICNLASFEHWRKQQEKDIPELLFISSEYLSLRTDSAISEAQFPDTLAVQHVEYKLSYQFEPGHKNDGITIGIPAGLLNDIHELRLQWLVPGMLRDKCIALVKALPKSIRKQFVPVPHFVDRVLPRLKANNESLGESLARELYHLSNVKISKNLWSSIELDSYYQMNIHVLDEAGKVIDQGRNLDILRARNKVLVKKSLSVLDSGMEKTGITQWNFGALPQSCSLNQGPVKLKGFPSVFDEVSSVAVKICESEERATSETRRGLARLLSLKENQTSKYLRKELFRSKELGLAVVRWGTRQEIADELILKAFYDACLNGEPLPRDEQGFLSRLASGRLEVIDLAFRYEKVLHEMLTHILAIRKAMKTNKNALALTMTFADINQQLEPLLVKDFLFLTPGKWLEQLPRYLRAIAVRLEKAPANPKKDQLQASEIQDLWRKHCDRLETHGLERYQLDLQWQEYRWMIEELRVSLFAQTLKTIAPVSVKRLNKVWADLIEAS